MRKLTIESFSCVDQAELELGQLTILTGPQASGKSVLSKLVYYFASLLNEHYQAIADKMSMEKFKDLSKKRFCDLFPESAWGRKKFNLFFQAGEFDVRIVRSSYRGKINNNLRFSFSHFFEESYNAGINKYESYTKRYTDIDAGFMLMRNLEREIARRLKKDYIQNQLFIPAGRSFFTSAGKAFVVFEHGNFLDPIISRFGRLFSSIRDRAFRINRRMTGSNFLSEAGKRLLGGRLKFEREAAYIEAEDGRKVPFPAMSSGQQELLPLVLTLDAWGESQGEGKQLAYIEEPEAHLFPSAQSALVEMLAQFVNTSKGRTELFITTHSPYVLAKLNNLMKAYEIANLSKDKMKAEQVAGIVLPQYWTDPRSMRAYAICEKQLRRINESSYLIDADYLDEVSNDISREFSALLDIEIN